MCLSAIGLEDVVETVHHLEPKQTGPELSRAVDGFLAEVSSHNTARAYAIALRALVAELGAATPVATLDDEATVDRIGAWFSGKWGKAAAATANARLDAVALDTIVWRTQTARLLPRMLDGRRTGPVFLTDRRARVELPPIGLDSESGRARLSYRRAAECFEDATEKLPGGSWTLHQLRHSALTHTAEDGANTSTLLAFSGHTSVASLAPYARVSPEGFARWQQQRDPASRRR